MGQIPMWAILLIEGIVVCLLLMRVFLFVRNYRSLPNNLSVEDKVSKTIKMQFKSNVISTILTREILVIYYLFAKKKESNEDSSTFTFHKDAGYSGFLIAIIFALILEGVGISFLLHRWNDVVAWVHTFLSLYAIIFLISDFKAMLKNPFILTEKYLIMPLGLRFKVEIEIDNIETIRSGKLNYEKDKWKKDSLEMTLIGFEEPNFEIVLKEPVVYRNFLGKNQAIRNIYINVDDKNLFYKKICDRIGEERLSV